MKQWTIVTVALTLAAGGWTGCGQQESAPAAPPAKPAAAVPAAPAPAPTPAPTPAPAPAPAAPVAATPPAPASAMDVLGSVKTEVQKAYGLAKESKYQDALAVLAKKAVEVKDNPEAMKLINTATTEIKKMMAGSSVKDAAGAATKAVGDLLK